MLTASITVASDGGSESVVWNVPMQGSDTSIVTVDCSIEGFPGGPFNLHLEAPDI
jgi:hypothetical protein